MTHLVFNLGGRCHCVRDFLPQQLPVTITQTMKSLFHCVLSHAKLARNFSLRWPIWFIREQCVQTLQQWWVKRPFRFLAQSREHPVEYCERPSTIIKQIG